ncbi:MAG: hypothetical protein ACRCUT_06365 [Spirochaetota bacterium]
MFLFLLITGCVSSGEKAPPSASFSADSGGIALSETPIDKSPGRQIFFALPADLSCVTIDVQGEISDETILKGTRPEKIYFIAEKILQLPGQNSRRYYELARNYSADWIHQHSVTICSDRSSPVFKLTKGIYRIRMTSFSKAPFHVKITVDTKSARFYPDITTAESFLSEQKEPR